MMKKLFALLLVLTLILGCTVLPASAAEGFTDVDPNEYYAEPVQWAVARGITTGMTDTTFGPELKCTRAQAVTFIWRLIGEPLPEKICDFTDLDYDEYYVTPISWAVETGVTTGMTETTFGPDLPCTRAQIVTFLWRVCGKPIPFTRTDFTDLNPNEYYMDAVSWATENEITMGMTPTTFGPGLFCTRAQTVTFLWRTDHNPPYTPPGKEGCLEFAKAVVRDGSMGKIGVMKWLKEVGYSEEEIAYAMENCKADWNAEAVEEAQFDLEYYAMSYEGLRRFMMSSDIGFTQEEVDYAVQTLQPDWKAEAVEAAVELVQYTLSRAEVLNDLTGSWKAFTPEQAEYAIANAPIDWKNIAVLKAESILNYMPCSRQELISRLTSSDCLYLPEEAEYAVDHCGADWNEQATRFIERYAADNNISRNDVRVISDGSYTKEQIEYGLAHANVDWVGEATEIGKNQAQEYCLSRAVVFKDLTSESNEFTEDEASEAMKRLDKVIDWNQHAMIWAQRIYGNSGIISRKDLADHLVNKRLFTQEEALNAVQNLDVSWLEDAVECLRFHAMTEQCSRREAKLILAEEMFTPEEIEYAMANANISWTEQAELCAKRIHIEFPDATRDEVVKKLTEDHEFTQAEAEQGADFVFGA